MRNKIRISRTMSYYLRHSRDLKLSGDGFVIISDLLEKLRERNSSITRDDLEKIVKEDPKGRFEISNDKIRALYGHSVDLCMDLPPTDIDVLYHGTGKDSLKMILDEGIKPMGRKKVHLSVTIEDAAEVAKRRKAPIVLKIDAKSAIKEGVKNPAAETAGRLKLNICFQCHSRLSGILPTCSGSQERFWTSQNDRNKELRQRPQGVKFIKIQKATDRVYLADYIPGRFISILNLAMEQADGRKKS